MPRRAYVGLGSNLNDPIGQLRRALASLAELPRSDLAACSPFYRSAPMGPPGQPDYINAVAALDTVLAPLPLLEALQGIETRQGRVRGPERWGPRTLDLDLLLYGDLRMVGPQLSLPHPGLHQRAFVLYPLADIAPPDLHVPGHGTLQALLRSCPAEGLQRLEDD